MEKAEKLAFFLKIQNLSKTFTRKHTHTNTIYIFSKWKSLSQFEKKIPFQIENNKKTKTHQHNFEKKKKELINEKHKKFNQINFF